MKRIRLLMLVMCLACLVMYAGCDTGSAKQISLVSGEECKCVIVGDSDKNYVSAIATKINAITGVSAEIYSPEKAPEGQTRIVIGNPEELGPEELIPEIPYFGYIIRIVDGDVYILAYHDDVLVEAATAFLANMNNWYADGEMTLASDYEVMVTLSDSLPVADIPYLEGGENASVHDCDGGHQMVILEDVQLAEFETYCSELVAGGYTLYAENEINGNLFRTYYNNEGLMLHTYWTEYYEEVRTIVAETSLLPIVSNADAESVCTPILYQMEGADENGYILRIPDGRFIIIDGGIETEENADEIYNFLKDNALNPDNIVIAAWYITHAHDDHYGGLLAFSEKYADDSSFTVESFLFNPCDTTEQMQYCSSGKAVIQGAFANYYADVPVYKPLTGQLYVFGKTTIEILYTMSDFMPNTIEYEIDGKGGDYNVQSVVSIIDIDSTADLGDRWFVMGDITTVACNEMCYRYGDRMKCDIVQVAHHGLAPIPGGTNCRRHCATVEIYELINPDIALWPASVEKVAERIELEVNDYLASIVDEIAIGGEGPYTIEFK